MAGGGGEGSVISSVINYDFPAATENNVPVVCNSFKASVSVY